MRTALAGSGPARREQHAEMADQWLEPVPVARRGDHHLRLDPLPVREHHVGAVEPLHRGDQLQPPGLERGDEPAVERRPEAPHPQLRRDAVRRARHAVRREVAPGEALHQEAHPVHERRRRVLAHPGEQGCRHPQELRRHDVHRSAKRHAHPCGSVHEPGRDLRAGVPGADDEHVPAAIRVRVAKGRAVQKLSRERVTPGPVGHPRHAVVAGRDDHEAGVQRPRRGQQRPVPFAAIDAFDLDPEPHVEPLALGDVLEVGDERLAGRPGPGVARESARAGGPRAAAPCSGAGRHSARASSSRPRRLARARSRRRLPRRCSSTATPSPAAPAPITTTSASRVAPIAVPPSNSHPICIAILSK